MVLSGLIPELRSSEPLSSPLTPINASPPAGIRAYLAAVALVAAGDETICTHALRSDVCRISRPSTPSCGYWRRCVGLFASRAASRQVDELPDERAKSEN